MSLRNSEAELCREINELMEDQPKPTRMKLSDLQTATYQDQPKPATGEWTVEYVKSLTGATLNGTCLEIADAHNAAVKEAYDAQSDAYVRRINELSQQLAAERERSKELSEDCEHYSEVMDKQEQQLAAEEDKRADWNVVIEDLERQLAAEREKVKALVEAPYAILAKVK